VQAQHKVDANEEVDVDLEGNAKRGEDIGNQCNDGGEQTSNDDIDLGDKLDADYNAVFAAASNNADDDFNEDRNNGSNNVGINEHVDLNLDKEINGNFNVGDDYGDDVVGLVFTIEETDLNINFNLKIEENIQNIMATATWFTAGDEARVGGASHSGGSGDGLGAGEEAKGEEGEEGSEAEGDHFC